MCFFSVDNAYKLFYSSLSLFLLSQNISIFNILVGYLAILFKSPRVFIFKDKVKTVLSYSTWYNNQLICCKLSYNALSTVQYCTVLWEHYFVQYCSFLVLFG